MFYEQPTGVWTDDNGVILVTGCLAGNNLIGEDMNNPASQFIHDRGPLPQGVYTIGPLKLQPAVHSLGCVLTPDPANNMGEPPRGGFFLHLRNLNHVAPDGTNASSDGCITFKSYADLAAIGRRVADGETKMTVVAVLPDFNKKGDT